MNFKSSPRVSNQSCKIGSKKNCVVLWNCGPLKKSNCVVLWNCDDHNFTIFENCEIVLHNLWFCVKLWLPISNVEVSQKCYFWLSLTTIEINCYIKNPFGTIVFDLKHHSEYLSMIIFSKFSKNLKNWSDSRYKNGIFPRFHNFSQFHKLWSSRK